ncbi:MAG: MgtC/SapB family protein [Candidatus Thermoplasmatota archaeon]|nr:MgtC/SapB family protein [Euryarchaeota archaeon]MBU4031396.1 MgtC/SapB family protein [Candidatus Thermoplasmatota archaeon]MBU4072232.1 MgtC/SapB family protein [Candidatus Thermoplasmatota archaeon]MBU4145277.1 MgtC/SapB family protein [Candidatus Thermoplasmatota archaeon]MBU4591241.1 MgtC/SapB family protein [Candidatus Thermoplasmatota archaeon]
MLLDLDIMLYDFLPKILLSIFCGSLIGLERELRDKPAGMRTYMLISVGATLFTMISIYFVEQWSGTADPLRVAAQIVTGVGFLGAGTIMFARGRISGLTSAAAIWTSAAIGMAIGMNMHLFAMLVTLLVVASLILLGKVERVLGLKGRRHFKFKIVMNMERVPELQDVLKKSQSKFNIIEMETLGEKWILTIECDLTRSERAGFKKILMKLNADFKMLDD